MFRQCLITTTLVAHAAAAMLGHAGLHAVLGHHHGVPSISHSSHDHGHQHVHCAHGGHRHHDHDGDAVHGNSGHDDGQQSSPASSHYHDHDCLACQFAAQHQAPLALFQMPASAETSESAGAATVQLARVQFELAYDSRGPPAV